MFVCEPFIDFIFLAACLTGIIWRLMLDDRGYFFLEYESWCVVVEAIYYGLIMVLGFITNCSGARENCLHTFLKYTLFKLIFAPILACPIIFFLGYNLHWFKYTIDLSSGESWCDIVNHLIAPACVLVDVLLFGRKYTSPNLFDIILVTGMYVAYSILCLPFMSNHNYIFVDRGAGCIISTAISFYSVGLIMYYAYITITKVRNCGTATN